MLYSKTIRLRFVEPDDAEFILGLRLDIRYNQYLSTTINDVNAQRNWIKEYKSREREGKEYYFIIERKIDEIPIGTVRLYDFIEQANSFCWGSWILNEDKTRFAAIESAMLVYRFAFEEVQFSRSHFDVRKENKSVLSFHRKMGAKEMGEDELNVYFHYFPESYREQKVKLKRFLIS
ncbi:GNAT family N-acetyltransferase [Endozoicomonas sp. SESOKO1]|uniref:GNAT family N-acetyltransferase n=1 Tax=Endozoicomonas sp. SESOKO1 TaxID=2828742 RepID=UPI0021497D18|nr:GNAT family N-acetyltransferase [Endozoicomonas sp. SESOKO1]